MIAIIGAMTKEVVALIDLMDHHSSTIIGGRTFFEGKINDFEVVVTVAGIGKVNASITTTLICEYYHPSLIINVGVAGGLRSTLNPLDIVIGTKVGYHDLDLTTHGALRGQLPDLPRFFTSDERLVNSLENFHLKNRKILTGTILTGDQFITNLDYFKDLIKQYFEEEKIYGVDMESAAIAHVAYTFKIPFIVIRSISDVIGSNDQLNDYDNFVEEACVNATAVTKQILSQIK